MPDEPLWKQRAVAIVVQGSRFVLTFVHSGTPVYPKRTMKRKRRSHARLDPFSRGVIWGMHLAKAPREEILQHVVKTDGTVPSMQAVDQVIKHKKDHPDWRGQGSKLVGRPSALTEAQRKSVVSFVFKKRGSAKVTVKY